MGEININENSNGSVTPHTKEHTAHESIIPVTAFLFSGLAFLMIANTAPGIPNIMHGKNPDMYIPRDQDTSALVSPAQKCVRSPRPVVSNQNTLLSA
jgi:hypothetical protein